MRLLAHIWKLLKEGVAAFIGDEVQSRGAAIAFYAMAAFAPVLYIAAAIAGLVFGREAASNALSHRIGHLIGHDGEKILYTAIHNSQSESSSGFWANVIGVVALIVTASGVFSEMQSALNAIWKASPEGTPLWRLVRIRLVSVGLVLALGFLLLVSLAVTAAVEAMGERIRNYFLFSGAMVWSLNIAISFVLMSLLFAAIFKILPDKDLEWRDVIAGAVGTSALFIAGEYLIGAYLGSSTVGAAYGPAAGILVLLMWIYYTTQIFLLGAEFTKVYSQHHGSQAGASAERPRHLDSSGS